MNIEIKKVLDNMSILELQEVINYCQDKIELQAESEVAELDKQIAELQASFTVASSKYNGVI